MLDNEVFAYPRPGLHYLPSWASTFASEKRGWGNPGGCLLLTPHEVDFQGPSQQVQSWVWGPGLCQLSIDPP